MTIPIQIKQTLLTAQSYSKSLVSAQRMSPVHEEVGLGVNLIFSFLTKNGKTELFCLFCCQNQKTRKLNSKNGPILVSAISIFHFSFLNWRMKKGRQWHRSKRKSIKIKAKRIEWPITSCQYRIYNRVTFKGK